MEYVAPFQLEFSPNLMDLSRTARRGPRGWSLNCEVWAAQPLQQGVPEPPL